MRETNLSEGGACLIFLKVFVPRNLGILFSRTGQVSVRGNNRPKFSDQRFTNFIEVVHDADSNLFVCSAIDIIIRFIF